MCQVLSGGCVALLFLLMGSAHAQTETYFFHNDHLGTPQAVTDTNQQVVWQGEYSPFGEVTETVNLIEQNLRFPGQYYDQETELHYNYFRNYDSSIGRYVESDPIGLGGGVNTYSYVENSPFSWTDPLGLNKYSGQLPPDPIPNGPWELKPDGKPGEFQGPKQDTGPRAVCRFVPDENNGGPKGATKPYWKVKLPGAKGWDRYDTEGKPITPQQAHPGKNKNVPKSKLLKLLPIIAPLSEMVRPSPQRVPAGSPISPYM